ncbi:MAG: hypothetical protein QF654_00010 [Alphaproteobacteria bacterium]|mgnify:CR=1 FL=1|jgi:hypothetical protein|nr:hypothetical protein [Alphaproteobacteria bacterium]
MTRHLENIFIVLFVVISAPLAAGVVTVMVTGAYLMLFGDGLPTPAEASAVLAPVGAVTYGTLCWLALRRGE